MRASDIKNVQFKQKISGYAKQEVDDYLKQVRVAMEKLEEQNADLQESLNEANKEVDAAHRKEATVNRSIFVAQEAADRLRKEALDEAALIVERSEEEGRRILSEAAEKAAVVNTETDNLQEAARTYLHQSFGMILQAKDMYEDPRWENLFFDKPVGVVETPMLDEIVKDYDLPVRSDRGPAIFDDAAVVAEKEQRKEEFFNNDIPAVSSGYPVINDRKSSNETVEKEVETSNLADPLSADLASKLDPSDAAIEASEIASENDEALATAETSESSFTSETPEAGQDTAVNAETESLSEEDEGLVSESEDTQNTPVEDDSEQDL